MGGSSSEAYDAWTTDADSQTGYGLLGCCRCMLANRVAFTFDFRGPSYTLDTACSSSMFALDAAHKSVMLGECDMALVAGVNLLLKPNCSLDFHRLSMLSQDGSCKVNFKIEFVDLNPCISCDLYQLVTIVIIVTYLNIHSSMYIKVHIYSPSIYGCIYTHLSGV